MYEEYAVSINTEERTDKTFRCIFLSVFDQNITHMLMFVFVSAGFAMYLLVHNNTDRSVLCVILFLSLLNHRKEVRTWHP
jgi:hypothetical protein